MLSRFPHPERTPISVEWTVPYEQTVFHLGVHNLPLARAKAWMDELAAFTADPQQPLLREILHGLSSEPDTLLIFNHPFWDVENAGTSQQHRDSVAIFLQKYGHLIHALEINGMRSRVENETVLQLAETVDLPADLPLLCVRDVQQLLAAARRRGIALAPDRGIVCECVIALQVVHVRRLRRSTRAHSRAVAPVV